MDNPIKLGAIGHYSWQNACQTATICYVDDSGTVNLAGYSHTGDSIRREEVKVGPLDGDEAEFHLPADCPWNR